MGVYIKGMEMPKKCKQCWFFGADSERVGYCYLLKGELPLPGGVPQDCPLIEVPKWIPVTERLPEEYEYVLCKTDYGMKVGYHRDEWGQDEWTTGEFGSGTIDVSHWMPLPEPPESEGGNES